MIIVSSADQVFAAESQWFGELFFLSFLIDLNMDTYYVSLSVFYGMRLRSSEKPFGVGTAPCNWRLSRFPSLSSRA